jgi:hypothetical protein
MCGLWSLEAKNETEKTPTLSLSPIVGKRMQQIMSGFQSVQSTLLPKKKKKKKPHEKIKWVFINTKNQLIIIIIIIIISFKGL